MTDTPPPDRFNEARSAFTIRGVETPDLESGVAAIRGVVRTLPARPGVYRMLNGKGDVLYVGKAKALSRRVANYTQIARLTRRIQRMVSQTRSMVIVTTETESEALLLEAQLIKSYRPPYNVLLRDDKSFPFILLREDHAFPRIQKHRGARRAQGRYYGPFASGGAVTRTLNALQKLFLLRSCTDSYFATRDRPCLLYQIRRCSAPCVGKIGPSDYAELVADAQAFLGGKSTEVQAKLAGAMQAASDALDFELAAIFRDRLKALTFIQGAQALKADGLDDADVFAIHANAGIACIQAFFIRNGQNWGHRAFFPSHTAEVPEDEVLASFLTQFYEDVSPAGLVLVDRPLEDARALGKALGARVDYRVELRCPQRGSQRKLVEQASRNAIEALERRMAESSTQAKILGQMAETFELGGIPQRIEVYDNSHIMGTDAIGAMIVAGPEGFRKNAYRKFNIRNPETRPGDDFAMMREVLGRRFARLEREDPDRESGDWPDLLLSEVARPSAVCETLQDMGISDMPVIGVSKGPDRNAGREHFHFPDGREILLPPNSPLMFYVQRLRDEAHRFAIGTHRAKRAKSFVASPLDEVPGVGPARKKALLLHFGTARAVREAALADLEKAPGVSRAVARTVYDHFHPEG